jgi:hypothetical protein
MSGINVRRVILGGLAAGLMANAFDFVITTYLMATEFAAMMARLNVETEPSQSWTAVFVALDFLWGGLLVFTYAAIRPRFGAGPKTAIISGVVLWLVLASSLLFLLVAGLHTPPSYAKSASLYLVSAIVCSLVGAAVYKE